MPELRRDPLTRRYTIIAPERAVRPSKAWVDAPAPLDAAQSPFAAGNEHLTPPEIYALRPAGGRPNDPHWRVRVIPNRYPALRVEGSLDPRPEGLYDHLNGLGAHEVIIESPDPAFRLQRLPHEHLVQVLTVYRDRMRDLRGDRRLRFPMLFRNHGAASGASVAHGHAQLIALPVVPDEAQRRLDGAQRYWQHHERNLFTDLVRQEIEDGRRVVAEIGDCLVYAPYASRVPFELCILPRYTMARFEALERPHLEGLAQALSLALDRLDRALGDPPYNLVVQTLPYDLEDVPWYRWQIQIMPNLTRVAGFELGTGFFINPTPPEEAAAFLRTLADPEAR